MNEKLTRLREKMQEHGYQAAIIGNVQRLHTGRLTNLIEGTYIVFWSFKSAKTNTRASTWPSMITVERGFRASRARQALPWLLLRKLPCGPTPDITLLPMLSWTKISGSWCELVNSLQTDSFSTVPFWTRVPLSFNSWPRSFVYWPMASPSSQKRQQSLPKLQIHFNL